VLFLRFLQFLQGLGATDGHLPLLRNQALFDPAAARFHVGAQPFDIGLAVGPQRLKLGIHFRFGRALRKGLRGGNQNPNQRE
jgi:hypothetical protein